MSRRRRQRNSVESATAEVLESRRLLSACNSGDGDDHVDTLTSDATPVTVSEGQVTFCGIISDINDSDVFLLAVDEAIELSFANTDIIASPHIEIVSASDNSARQYVGLADTVAQLNTGHWFVRIAGFPGFQSGEYNIVADTSPWDAPFDPDSDDHPDNIAPDATDVELSEGQFIFSGAIESPGDADVFRIQIDEGVELTFANVDSLEMPAFEAAWSGDFAIRRFIGGGVMRLEPGDWYVRVQGQPGFIGTYEFVGVASPWEDAPASPVADDHVNQVGPDATPVGIDPLTDQVVLSGRIHHINDADVFEVFLEQPTTLEFTQYASPGSPDVHVASSTPGTAWLSLRSGRINLSAGTWYLIVAGNPGAQSVDYLLKANASEWDGENGDDPSHGPPGSGPETVILPPGETLLTANPNESGGPPDIPFNVPELADVTIDAADIPGVALFDASGNEITLRSGSGSDSLRLPPGNYRLTVIKPQESASPFAIALNSRNVFVDPVSLTSGAGKTISNHPRIEWDPVADAVNYEVWISYDGELKPVYRQQGVEGTSLTVPQALAENDYTVWVRAHLAGERMSRWGAGEGLQIVKRTELSPAGTTLNWPALPSISAYPPRTIEVTQTGNHSGYRFSIEDVRLVNGEVWVLTQLAPTGGLAFQAFTTFTASTAVNIPSDLPLRHFRLHGFDPPDSEHDPSRTGDVKNHLEFAELARTTDPDNRVLLGNTNRDGAQTPDSVMYELWIDQLDDSGRVRQEKIIHEFTRDRSFDFQDVLGPGDYRGWVRGKVTDPAGHTIQSAWSRISTFAVAATSRETLIGEWSVSELNVDSVLANRLAKYGVTETMTRVSFGDPPADSQRLQFWTDGLHGSGTVDQYGRVALVDSIYGYQTEFRNVSPGRSEVINRSGAFTTIDLNARELAMLGRGIIQARLRRFAAGQPTSAWTDPVFFMNGTDAPATVTSISQWAHGNPRFNWTEAARQLTVANRPSILQPAIFPAPVPTYDVHVAEAVSYDVRITDGVSHQEVIHQTDVAATAWTATPELPPGSYDFQVRAVYSDATIGEWSEPFAFSVMTDAVPVILQSDSTVDATPVVSWQPVPGALSYEIFVQRDGESTAAYRAFGIQDTRHRIDVPQAPGDYTVWIRSHHAHGVVSRWGRGSMLTIGAAPEVRLGNALLTWQPVDGATHYEVWADEVDGRGQTIRARAIHQDSVFRTQFVVPSQSANSLRFRVRAIRNEGTDTYRSLWSSPITTPDQFNDDPPILTLVFDAHRELGTALDSL